MWPANAKVPLKSVFARSLLSVCSDSSYATSNFWWMCFSLNFLVLSWLGISMWTCVQQFCLNLQFLSIKLANFSYEIIIAGLSPCITAIWLGQDYRYPCSHISHHSCPPFLYFTVCSTYLVQLQKAAKLLDSGAVRATRFLWRYPTARVILLFYLVRRVHVVLITKIIWNNLSCILTMRNFSSGICTFLLDVSDASSSGTDIWPFALVLWEVCFQPW